MALLDTIAGVKPEPRVDLSEYEEAGEGFDLWELTGRAFRDDSLLAIGVERLEDYREDRDIIADDTFGDTQKEEAFASYKNIVSDSYKNYIFNRAKNAEHFRQIADEMVIETEKEQAISDLGIGTSFMMRMGAELTNLPLYIYPPAVVPRIALSASSTLGRRVITGGAVEAVFEYAKDVMGEKERTAMDYALGVTMGAGAYAAFGQPTQQLLDSVQNRMKSYYKIDKDLETKLESASASERKDILDAHFEKNQLGEVSKFQDELNKIQEEARAGTFHQGTASKLRVDLAHLTATSKSNTMRQFSDQNFIDGTLQGNQTNRISANEAAQQTEDSIVNISLKNFNPIINDFSKEVFGKGAINERFSERSRDIVSALADEAQHMKQFFDVTDDEAANEVVKKIIGHNVNVDPMKAMSLAKRIVKAAGDSAEEHYDALARAGKRGFVDGSIPKTRAYNTIVYRSDMDEMLEANNMKRRDFDEFIFGSLRSKAIADGDDLTDAKLQQLRLVASATSGKIFKSMHEPSYVGRGLDDMMIEALETEVKAGRVTQEFFDSVVKKTIDPTATESIGVYSRTRTNFDYGYKVRIPTVNGDIKDFSFMDMVSKNYLGNNIQYARKMGGALALEKTTLRRSVDRFEEIKSAVRQVSKGMREGNLDKVLPEVTEKFPNIEAQLIKLANDTSARFGEAAGRVTRDLEGQRVELEQLGEIMSDADFQKRLQEEIDLAFKQVDVQDIDDQLRELSKFDDEIDLSNQANIDKAREWIKQDLKEQDATQREMNSELARFDEMILEYKGQPTSTDPFGTGTQVQRILSNLNIARLLGQTGITMSAEFGGVMFETGVRNAMEFGTMRNLMNQMKTGKINDTLAQEIQTYVGLGDSLNRAIGGNRYDHEFNMSALNTAQGRDLFLNKAERWSERFAEATLLLGGVKPLQAQFEMMMSKSIINKMTQLASKAEFSPNDIKWFNEAGIDEVTAKRIKAQIDKYGSYEAKEWSNGHKVQSLGFDKWDDDEAGQLFTMSVRRLSNTIVQRSQMGDKTGILWGDKFVKNTLGGKMFLELKDYMITSYVKQLGRAMTRRDAYMFGFVVSQATALSMATSFQNMLNYAGNEKKLEESFEPKRFMQTVVAKMPQSSYMPQAIDGMLQHTIGEKLFSDSRFHSGLQGGFMSIPTVDLVNKTLTLMQTPARIAKGEAGTRDVNAFTGVVPLGNWYGTKPIAEAVKE